MRKFLFIVAILFAVFDVTAQQLFEKTQSNSVTTKGMVAPFSTQSPDDVYNSRHLQRSKIRIQYNRRDAFSAPVSRRTEIVDGVVRHHDHSSVMLNAPTNTYYTQTPQKATADVATTVAYNSFPTINSKGEAMNISEESSVVEIGSMQNLPEDWDEPSNPTPVGDILFPMLLLVGAYLSIRLFKGFNN